MSTFTLHVALKGQLIQKIYFSIAWSIWQLFRWYFNPVSSLVRSP